jgi:hypothetical protein
MNMNPLLSRILISKSNINKWARIWHHKADSSTANNSDMVLYIPPDGDSKWLKSLLTFADFSVQLSKKMRNFLKDFIKFLDIFCFQKNLCDVTHLISYSSSRCGLLAKSHIGYGTICWQDTNSPWTMLRKWHNLRRYILKGNKIKVNHQLQDKLCANNHKFNNKIIPKQQVGKKSKMFSTRKEILRKLKYQRHELWLRYQKHDHLTYKQS